MTAAEKKSARRDKRRKRRRRVILVLSAAAFLALLVVLADRMLITIEAGHVGVLWSRFGGGTITDRTYGEGMHVIFPWDEMTPYSVRFQSIQESFTVMTKDGLEIEAGVFTRFKPIPESVAMMHKHVGPDYVDLVIRPEIAATARQVIAKMAPSDLYSEKRVDVQNLIAKKAGRRIGLSPEAVETSLLVGELDSRDLEAEKRRAAADADSDDPKDPARKRRKKIGKAFPKDEDEEFVNVQEVLLQNVALPGTLGAAIEGKLEQQQADLEYVYRLQREEKEKQRKIIEAEGIREFQRISGVSVAKWRGIEATLELASSPDVTLVFTGSRETGGLPLILGPPVDGEPNLPPASPPQSQQSP